MLPALPPSATSAEIALVEDCAQAIGGKAGGLRAGTFGDVAALSFYPTKNLGAAGDGGAIATDDPRIADRVRSLRQYGWSPRYVVTQPNGRNSRLDEIQAAILRIGLRRVDEFNERRREIAHRYGDAIHGSGIRLVTGAGVPTVAHLAIVRAIDRTHVRAVFKAARWRRTSTTRCRTIGSPACQTVRVSRPCPKRSERPRRSSPSRATRR